MIPTRVVILGAGPAGLAASWLLARERKAHTVVLEQRGDVGGNAGSFEIGGIPVDYGSHRLHPACRPDILRDIRNLLGDDLLDRPRHGRIRLRDRWIRFPLRPLDLVSHMPPSFGARVASDLVRKALDRRARGDNFASELEHNLGRTICRDFYFPYAEKIWGLPATGLSVIQARRRVSAASISKMILRVLALVPGLKAPGAGRFFYPRLGYGQISRAVCDAAVHAGADVQLNAEVKRIALGRPHQVEVRLSGAIRTLEADQVWSTIPIPALCRLISPAAPTEVLDACSQISYRAMLLIYLELGQGQFTPYDAHYFPERDIAFTRLSEPKNYSARAHPSDRTVLCAELPCGVDDEVWRYTDRQLSELVCEGLARCGLPMRAPVLQIVTKRLSAAYPIYRRGYEEPFNRLDVWVAGLPAVLSFGRQGLFAHDNTHHTMAMAYAASECLDSRGNFDQARWQEYRTDFESHVVED
jgi:protoporphyrinogen oxidase